MTYVGARYMYGFCKDNPNIDLENILLTFDHQKVSGVGSFKVHLLIYGIILIINFNSLTIII